MIFGKPCPLFQEAITYYVKSSDVWNVWQKYHFQQNRLLPRQDQFNNFLLKLGSNRLPTKQEQPFQGCIKIPDPLIEQVCRMKELIELHHFVSFASFHQWIWYTTIQPSNKMISFFSFHIDTLTFNPFHNGDLFFGNSLYHSEKSDIETGESYMKRSSREI